MPSHALTRWARPLAWLVLVAVVLAAALQATRAYTRFLGEHRHLWYSSTHDRGEHYFYALEIATAVRQGDVPGLLGHLARSAVWPPLHGVLAGAVLAVGGPDYRLAVLPSLLAWAGCAVLAYLLTRRCLPAGGTLAGLVPVAFLLASPMHHAHAVDIMLESIGAFFTLFCLYCYVRAAQDGVAYDWRLLALALTALLLNKYNYYVLVVVALGAAELTARGRSYLAWAWDRARCIDWCGLARRELRHPLAWLLALTLLVALGIWLRGPRPLVVGNTTVNIYPPGNLLQLAYALLCARLALACYPWRRLLALLDERARQVVLWHVVPAALFMLLPRHIASFLWYVSPLNKFAHQRGSFLDGVQFYGQGAVEHYHLGIWSAVLAVVLFVVAIGCSRRLRPGASAVLWLGVLAALLTARHPNQQLRYLHSWIAVVWVGAGIGTAAWLALLAESRRRAFVFATAGVALAVALAHAPGIAEARRSPHAGPLVQTASLLDVTEAILAEGDRADRLGLLPAVPLQSVARWNILTRHGRLDAVDFPRHGFGPPGDANREGFRRWIETTQSDVIVYLEPVGYPFGADQMCEVRPFLELGDLIERQGRFRLVRRQEFPRQCCRMLVYRRHETAGLAGR
jgi:hypothetical protein